jgi:purine nucleosidase
VSRPLLIDTDPGVDDALALALAVRSPELELVGVTTVFGNATIETTTRNALALMHLFDRVDVPVATGAAAPLQHPYAGPVPQVHGHDGMGDSDVLTTSNGNVVAGITAAELMVHSARQRPGELTILALGPLTNLALALELDPSIATLIREVVVMGGNALCPGNATPAAEANMLGDPEAADQVLGAAWPVTMVGLDVTHAVNLKGTDIDRLAASVGAVSALVSQAIPHYRAFFEQTNKIDGIYLHDPTAVAFLLWPEFFETTGWPIRVETKGFSRGKTWPSLGDTDDATPLPWVGRPRVSVCTGVNKSSVVRAVLDRLL